MQVYRKKTGKHYRHVNKMKNTGKFTVALNTLMYVIASMLIYTTFPLCT